MSGHALTSLIVGFPQAQSSGKLGALHRKFGLKQEEKIDIINGFTVEVPSAKVDAYVAALPPEASVMLDQPFFPATPPTSGPHRGPAPALADDLESAGPVAPPHLSRPPGLAALHAQGINGQGVTIAVVDSGIAPHQDFGDRVKFFKDFSQERSKKLVDSFGHGTHVAGIAAGDGELVDGIAPKADLVGLRITSPKEAIQAIDWAVENKEKYGLDVLNLSLGVEARLPNRQDPFAQAAQRAVDAGLITVIASGNECTQEKCQSTISTPGILPDAITVGAFHDHGTNDDLTDDTMWSRSSNGPTPVDGLPKPDLVASGFGVVSTSSPGSHLNGTRPRWESYHTDNGSSMATPVVSGTAALLLQLDPSFKQADIKELLSSTALPIQGVDKSAQGAGRLNLAEVIRQARAREAQLKSLPAEGEGSGT